MGKSKDYYKKKLEQLLEEKKLQDALIFQQKSLLDSIPGDIYWKDTTGRWKGANKHCVEKLASNGIY